MQSNDLIDAIDAWDTYWDETQRAAVTVMQTAFPRLVEQQGRCGCHAFRMEFAEGGFGQGRVCIDDEGRANVEFEEMPNTVITKAVDEVRFPFIEGSDGPLAEAPPGTYVYECEVTASEFEFVLGDHGLGKVSVLSATVPDAAAVLDALERAFTE
ncbi:hypothetical protein [Streptomyces sp. NPDC020965]|uniref:hypothetical protein n=1 Tax=Streptomyces sp. NPDC020965 TaxID=3365105 RepID=UPI0037AE75EE